MLVEQIETSEVVKNNSSQRITKSALRVFFFERINFVSAFKLLLSRDHHRRIFYIDASKAARLLFSFRGAASSFRRFNYKFYKVSSISESSYIKKVFDAIESDVLKRNYFVESFARIFNTEKIHIFFQKATHAEIRKIVLYMIMIASYRNRVKGGFKETRFYITDSPFFQSLRKIVKKDLGIDLYITRALKVDIACLFKGAGTAFLCIWESLKSLFNFINTRSHGNKPALGCIYTGSGLTFDLIPRCSFPWLLMMSKMREKDIVLYFIKGYRPAEDELLKAIIDKPDIRYSLLFDDRKLSRLVSAHRPSWMLAKKMIPLMIKTSLLMVKELMSGRMKSIYFLHGALRFVRVYSFWYDFFKSNNIKVNINRLDYDPYNIAGQTALRDLDGVWISAQLSCLTETDITCSSCADIMFMFSPYYYDYYIESGNRNESILYSGYLTDYSFEAVRDRSAKTRKKLVENGANFIICYFDENSYGNILGKIPHFRSARIYKTLLRRVISDKELGLVLNPKCYATLFKRLPDIEDLVQKAVGTGRCVLMRGENRTYNCPAEAAQIADIVITLLIGGTAALESYLSGSRVVYLDLEKLSCRPEYKYGKNKILFNDLSTLLAEIDNFRADRQKYDYLGNIKYALDAQRKDDFKDGLAAKRIAQYTEWLIEGFDGSMNRCKAIDYANQRYKETWGNNNVVDLRSNYEAA